jgi:L-lactate dehydrogenase complex protein LldG
MTDARAEVLRRLGEALSGPSSDTVIPRAYRVTLGDPADLIDLFADRVADYQAQIHRVVREEVGQAVQAALASRGARSVICPAGLPASWLGDLAEGTEVLGDDPPLSHQRLDQVDAVVTGCAVAIAETGTIVLDGGPAQGRRALSLLPDRHVCVVQADQIVGHVAEALGRVDPRRPLTWISGPSATSDIELTRVEGVHGPRMLDVIIVA